MHDERIGSARSLTSPRLVDFPLARVQIADG
jgi:hypothetical protein